MGSEPRDSAVPPNLGGPRNKGPSMVPETVWPCTLILAFPATRTNKYLLFRNYPVEGIFVMSPVNENIFPEEGIFIALNDLKAQSVGLNLLVCTYPSPHSVAQAGQQLESY